MSENLLKKLDYSVAQQCMHCAMCLPTCPTYDATGFERNSPRGRIAWMRAIADDRMKVDEEFAKEMYYCLGCLACMTACPAGVNYAELFETARAEIERTGVGGSRQRNFWRWLAVKTIFMRPRLLRMVARSLRLYQRTGLAAGLRKVRFFGLLPKRLAALEPQSPSVCSRFSNEIIQPVERPQGQVRYRVALLTGCIQDVAFSDINRDTADALLANGCEVLTPPVQPCCGSLHAHNGEVDLARTLARRMLDLFDVESLDAIITNAGGCGSHLKQYGHILHDDPVYAARAKLWDAKCKDIHEWLTQINFRAPTANPFSGKVTYHASCHLLHGQKIAIPPLKVLQSLPGIDFVRLPESDWCCGSAGIYNITQPEQSAKLLERKIKNIMGTQALTVATANPGCHLQIFNGLKAQGMPITIRHPVSMLAAAYRQENSAAADTKRL